MSEPRFLFFSIPDMNPEGVPPSEFKIFSYGKTETLNGDYEFDEEAACAVMANAASYGNKLTLDYEHQALQKPPVRAPAAGRYSIELRGDGLWATNVQWTPEASKHLKDKEYLYYSPAFTPDDKGRPKFLMNVALTNIPATKKMTPLVAAKAQFQETEMKTVLLALNLKDGASEAEALSAVTVLRQHQDHLVQLTGKVSIGEALAVVSAWKQQAEEVTALRARLEKQEADAALAAFDAEIAGAKAQTLLAASDDHKRNKAALSFKGKPGALDNLKAFISGLDRLLPDQTSPAVEPKPVSGGAVVLTAKEKEIAKKMNIAEDKMLANKVRLLSQKPVIDTDDDEEASA